MGYRAAARGGRQNTAIGVDALFEPDPDGTSGSTAVGYKALSTANSDNNTAVGHEALAQLNVGGLNTASARVPSTR